MPPSYPRLAAIFDGWDGYHTSIVRALQDRTPAELAFRPTSGPARRLRSVGELGAHIAFGRIDWFARMPAPGSRALAELAAEPGAEAAAALDRDLLLHWLAASWRMIRDTLAQFTVDDLWRSYPHEYWGRVYRVSFQWTIYRIFTHDLHHGGELALLLGLQGIEIPDLGDLFGHITEPPLWDAGSPPPSTAA